MDDLRLALEPLYFYLKAIHVVSVSIWSFSTAVAWVFYLKPAFLASRRNPEDSVARGRRDDFMERFDAGASLEHVAFVVMVLTALALIWLRDVNLTHWSFIPFKFWIGVAIILPMEVVDIYLSHLGGNKRQIRASGDHDRYEAMMEWHWRFFRITEPLVVILIPTMFFIAIVKPF